MFTPGPTPVPESIMLKMAAPMIHHRHPEFKEIIERVSGNLKYLFQTGNDVLTLTSSGTGAMEAAVSNLHSAGDEAVFVNGGKFGERWGEILKAYGVKTIEKKIEWGDSVPPDQIVEIVKKNPAVKAVYVTQSETSTGAATDVKLIASEVRKHSDALIVVDGITAVGAMELRMDAWGLDVVVTGSQKGLMIPPGLAFVAISPRAWEAIKQSKSPRYYFDLLRGRKSLESHDTPWTPAISLFVGVDQALEMIKKQGIEDIWARHERLSRAIREGASALGLNSLAKTASPALTALWIPPSIDPKRFMTILKKTYGITVAGGQGHLAGKIFRISHLGYYDELEMVTMISALEMTLVECGFDFEQGSGVRAAQQALMQRDRK